MTNIEAIAYLEKEFEENTEFKAAFQKLVEVTVLDETGGWNIKPGIRSVLAKRIGQRVIMLFQKHWWEQQGL